MGAGKAGAAGVSVTCETDAGCVELRLYGSDPVASPSLWVGMFDPAGALRRTWISDGADLTLQGLQRWLRPIVGYEVAGRLARMALHAEARASEDRSDERIVHLNGSGVAKAS